MKLTDRHRVFVDEYLIDMDAKAAYQRAGFKAKGNAAAVSAHRLLLKTEIQERIQKRMGDRAKRTEITQDKVLERWWAIATADPNELVYHRRVCCRYCFGRDHGYQWIDEQEFHHAVQSAQAMDKPVPSNEGGYGFDRTIRPHPICPNCRGEGYGEIKANDTRDLSPQGKVLYAGAKQTQAGFEIKMHDQLKASELAARHLGMFVNEVKHSGHISTDVEIVITGDDDDEA